MEARFIGTVDRTSPSCDYTEGGSVHLLTDAYAYGVYGGAVEALLGGLPEDSSSLLHQALRALLGEANFEFERARALASAGPERSTDRAIMDHRPPGS